MDNSARRTKWALAVAALLSGGCGPELSSGFASDTGKVTLERVALLPAAPQAPAPPALAPCPAGWRIVAGPVAADAPTCEPWPAGGRQSCAEDSAHFPGEPGCVRIGAACPSGDWAEAMTAGAAIRYVRAGAAAGGNGTQSAPFATVASAVAGAPAGTVVALSKGTFAEAVSVPAGVTLWGACVAQTKLSPSAGTAPTIAVRGANVVVRNLTVAGARPGLWVDTAGANLVVQDVVVVRAHAVGLAAFNATRITGSRIAIRDTQPFSTNQTLGQAIEAGLGGQIELSFVALEGNRQSAIAAGNVGSSIKLTDASVFNTLAEASSGRRGRGLSIHEGARLEATRVVIERSTEVGITAEDGANVTLSHVIVRDTQPSPAEPNNGFGINVASGSTLKANAVLVAGNRAFGMTVTGPGTTAALTDVVIRDTAESLQSKALGDGLLVGGGATLTAQRLSIERNRKAGINVEGVGSSATVEDLISAQTTGQLSDGTEGAGVTAQTGASLSVRRAFVDRNQCAGIIISDDKTSADLVDVAVSGTMPCLVDRLDGSGVVVQLGAAARAQRLRISDTRSAGILVAQNGSSLEAEDVAVVDVRGNDVDGTFGEGIHVQQSARVVLNRALVERTHEVGLFVVGSHVVATDFTLRQAQETQCLPTRCLARAGIGAAVLAGGYLSLTRFSLTQNASIGLSLSENGTADLRSGEIGENLIGVNVDVAGFDLTRLENEVTFRQNGRNLAADSVPLPPSDQRAR